MSSNRDIIIQFLRGKGLSDAAIYGVLGNLTVESSLNPGAYNPREGAIGIAQWEGSRRTALQSYAAAHGGSEGDLTMQLGYLWHELNTSDSNALQALESARTAGDAAAAFDTLYQRSSGSTHQQRINDANAYAGGGDPSNGESNTSGGQNTEGSLHTVNTADAVNAQRMTAGDYSSIDDLGSLLSSVPELKGLVNQAVAGNWTTDKFQNEVENSQWWKSNSSTARQVIIQKANDPASYAQSMKNTQTSIASLAHQLGMPLTSDEVQSIAASALLSGNDSNNGWLTTAISHYQNYSNLTSLSGLQGGMAATAQQLQSLAGDYGYKWTPAQVAGYAQQIEDGRQTIDTYHQQLQTWAKSAFPGLSQQIDNGATVKDLASPYINSMSNLLEIDPGSLDLFTPAIRKALQGSVPVGSKPGTTPTSTPLWQFEQQVRADPRWAYTQNATDTMSTALVQLGQTFGFGPSG